MICRTKCCPVVPICSSCCPLWDSNNFSGRKGLCCLGGGLVAAPHHHVTVFGGIFCSTIIASMGVWPQACSITPLRALKLPTRMGQELDSIDGWWLLGLPSYLRSPHWALGEGGGHGLPGAPCGFLAPQLRPLCLSGWPRLLTLQVEYQICSHISATACRSSSSLWHGPCGPAWKGHPLGKPRGPQPVLQGHVYIGWLWWVRGHVEAGALLLPSTTPGDMKSERGSSSSSEEYPSYSLPDYSSHAMASSAPP